MKLKYLLSVSLLAVFVSSCVSSRHGHVPRYKESDDERKASESRDKNDNVRSAPPSEFYSGNPKAADASILNQEKAEYTLGRPAIPLKAVSKSDNRTGKSGLKKK